MSIHLQLLGQLLLCHNTPVEAARLWVNFPVNTNAEDADSGDAKCIFKTSSTDLS